MGELANEAAHLPEGEKCADSLSELGLLALTNPFGAGDGKWQPRFSQQLAGRRVVIYADADDPGRAFAEEKARSLWGKAASIKVLDLYHGQSDRSDIANWIAKRKAAGRSGDSIRTELEVRVVQTAEWRPGPQAKLETSLPAAVSTRRVVPWPDALMPEAFHGLAGDFVRAIDPHTEADPAALLISYFVAVGNMIGRHPHFVADGAEHYTNLYAILVGRTSKSRKGSSQAQVKRPLKAVDPEWVLERIQSGLSSGEGLIWAVRDPIQKEEPVRERGRVVDYETVLQDPGVEDKRLLITEPEFASMLRVMGRDGNTLSAVVREAWDSGNLRTLTKNSPAKATGAHISILGHVTRDEVLRYLDSTEAGNGFANRFLWVCVRRSKSLPDGGLIHQVDFGPLIRRLTAVVEFAGGVGEMKRDDEARGLWHAVYPALSQEVPGLLGAVIARAEAQVMRLACIYALLDQSATVRRNHLEAALAVWSYCEASARFVFGDALGDPVADEILRVLRHAEDGLTRTEISNHFGRNRAASDISRGLTRLWEGGLAEPQSEAVGQGRPTERWYAVRPGQRVHSQPTK
jgi:hypothetical protein